MTPTRRNVLRAFAAFSGETLSLLRAASKSNFWDGSEPNQWTPSERTLLITNSPWAKSVRADASRAQPAGPPLGGSNRNVPMRMPGQVSGGDRGRGSGGAFPAFQGVVRWESAKPVLLALKRDLPAELAGHYVIGVSGFPLGLRNPQGDGKDVDASVGGPLDDLKQVTTLRVKGNDAAQAGIVMRSSDSDGPVYLFGFSQDVIAVGRSDKAVVFTTVFGPLEIEAKFEPKQMLYRGDLAL